MKRSTLISLIALGIAIAGALIALIAFFKRDRCSLCEDFEDEEIPIGDIPEDAQELSAFEDGAAAETGCETVECEGCAECQEPCPVQEEPAQHVPEPEVKTE